MRRATSSSTTVVRTPRPAPSGSRSRCTTPEIPDRLEPEVALLIAGVSTDVVGAGADALTPEEIAEVCAAQPRTNFADGILHAFHAGMKDRPQTTFGTMNVDVLAHFDPEFTRVDLVDLVVKNPLPQ